MNGLYEFPAQSSEVVAGFFRALHTGLGFAVRVANLACRNSGCKCNGRNAAPDEAATSSSITGERATMAAAGRSAARRGAAAFFYQILTASWLRDVAIARYRTSTTLMDLYLHRCRIVPDFYITVDLLLLH